jgi:hypothetical protein
VGYRLVKMARALAVLALTYVTTLILATRASFYQGTGSVGAHGPTEHTVQAAVQDCRRTGPLSDMGIGYWWVCRAQVTTDYGVVERVLDRSIATKSDIGRTIALAEACKAGVCHYGKAVGGGWQFYDAAVWMIGRALLIFLAVWTLFIAAAVVLGAPRYVVLGSWWIGKVLKRPNV